GAFSMVHMFFSCFTAVWEWKSPVLHPLPPTDVNSTRLGRALPALTQFDRAEGSLHRLKTALPLWITPPKKGKIPDARRCLTRSEFQLQDGTDKPLLAPLSGLVREGTPAPTISHLYQSTEVQPRR